MKKRKMATPNRPKISHKLVDRSFEYMICFLLGAIWIMVLDLVAR